MIEKSEFQLRRQKMFDQMAENSVAISMAEPEYPRTIDTGYTFHQNTDLYYLTGVKESDCYAVFIKDKQQQRFILFSRPHDPVQARWIGDFLGQERAVSEVGADEAFPVEQFFEKLSEYLANRQRVYYTFGRYPEFDARFNKIIVKLRAQARSKVRAPHELINLDTIVHELRLIKSSAEVELIQKSVDIDVKAQKRAMQRCRPGMYEYQLEAEIGHEFASNGATEYSFDAIVAGGKNGCTLHYLANNNQLKDGDLVLVDIGCEYEYYASDLTRTFPVNGRFSSEQQAVYEVVLSAQLAVIEAIAPGIKRDQLYDISARVITEGLCHIGLLSGDVDELIQRGDYKRFYMHNIGHWMGLDVHDVGAYYDANGQSRLLQSGMVLTVEPGIYISEGEEGIDSKWWNIGIRIEDDVLVTDTGHKVLSAAAPKTVEEIERLMQAD